MLDACSGHIYSLGITDNEWDILRAKLMKCKDEFNLRHSKKIRPDIMLSDSSLDMNSRLVNHGSTYRAALISRFVKAGFIDEAVKTFDKMINSECRVFSIDYNRFIGVVLVKNFGLIGRRLTYTLLVSGLSRVGRFEAALEFWNAMVENGMHPDPTTKLVGP
ncbi:hypothetical protein Dimus_004268 [Dionaea muscipula]